MVRRVVALVLASTALVACGGNHPKPKAVQSAPTGTDPGVVGDGRLVGIGGGRSLFVKCVGSGSPTILLEAGFGGSIDNWSSVQPQLGRTSRTCAYDRAGLGSSLAMPGVHDAGDEVDDLERLLDHAHIAPPYVLVGHSYGGRLVRLFAGAHPKETAALVLVDSVGRNQAPRLLRIWRAQPPGVRRQLPQLMPRRVEAGVDLAAGEALDAKVGTFGDTPLVVITRGRPDESLTGVPASLRKPADRLWTVMQDELAALSDDHVHVVALRSGHFVQRAFNGQPNVVVTAVRAARDAAGTSTGLPPCASVFHGPRVRCRG